MDFKIRMSLRISYSDKIFQYDLENVISIHILLIWLLQFFLPVTLSFFLFVVWLFPGTLSIWSVTYDCMICFLCMLFFQKRYKKTLQKWMLQLFSEEERVHFLLFELNFLLIESDHSWYRVTPIFCFLSIILRLLWNVSLLDSYSVFF